MWQADGKSDLVAEFLGLVSAKNYGKANHMFVALVDEVAGKMLLPAQEQQLQLKPTKAFKKVVPETMCLLPVAVEIFGCFL